MKINEIIDTLKKDPDDILMNIDEKQLKKIIDHLSDRYYNFNESLISDQLFDYIKEFYENNFNKNKKITIGAPISEKKNGKTKLPFFMGSLEKIKPSTNALDKWLEKYSGPYVLSYKLDGISALLYKKDNKINLYTRGNGTDGQDISHILNYININTEKMEEGDAIRGELIMTKTNFKKIKDEMANARNAVSGIVLTKKPDVKMLKLIDFVAYWVLNPQMEQREQMKYIEKKKFITKCVEYKIENKLTSDILSKMLLEGRNNYKYELDGVVVIDSSKFYPIIPGTNPDFGFAFKQILTDQIADTTVINVIWEISKDKYIKPKVKLDTVEIGGVEINYATANNAKFIVDNNIGPGSKVKIIRSGDVIPKIEEILSSSETGKPKMPSFNYEWNETKVDIIATDLKGEQLDKLIIKKLVYFFSTLDIKFMGEGNITKFVENGYNDLWKILLAKKSDIMEIEGFGKKSVENIYKSIDEGLTNRELYDIMAASQIFGRGIASKKFKSITDVYPNIMEIYKTKGKDDTIKLINAIVGFDVKTTNKIVDSMDNFIEYHKQLIKIKPNAIIDKNSKTIVDEKNESIKYSNINIYANKKIVFTGFRDKDIQNELEKIGAKISDSVSKNTDLVVASDISDTSGKIKKAIELDIKVISKDDFLKTLNK